MNTISAQIVGAHFRPPAKQVIGMLRAGATVWLQPEPDNPYDPKAIRASVVPADVLGHLTPDEIEDALEGTGTEGAELLAMEELHIGYIPDSDGKGIAKLGGVGNREILEAIRLVSAERGQDGIEWPWPGELQFQADGKPLVQITGD